MNTALTAVMTPQLMENITEFEINDSQEGWIVSIDNVMVVIMSFFSGILQTQYGPMRVNYVNIYLTLLAAPSQMHPEP